MRLRITIALISGAFALCALPALGVAHHSESHATGPIYSPSGEAKSPQSKGKGKGKAHGRSCKGQSKKHVKGEKGTPFSRCVKAAAQQRKEQKSSSSA